MSQRVGLAKTAKAFNVPTMLAALNLARQCSAMPREG